MLTNVLNNNTIEFKVGEVVYFAKEISSTQYIIQKTYAAKKSAKGLLRVDKIGDEYVLIDNCTSDEGGELKTIFEDGSFFNLPTFAEIRKRLSENE